MTFLDDLIKQAQGVLGQGPKLGSSTDAVRHTRFDAMIFSELVEEAPALADMVSELGQEWNYTSDMVRDVLMEFWQGDPRLRSADEMRPGWLVNRAVADHIENSPDTDQVRSYTIHDRYSSAMATIAVTDEIDDFLKRHRDEQEAAQEAADAAEQAAADNDQAQAGLSDAMEAAQEAGWPPIGPPSPTQQEATAALAAAMAQAEDAAMTADQQAQAAVEAHEEAVNGLQGAVQQGMQKAHKELQEEGDMMQAWGHEPGVLKKMNFKERIERAKRLRNSRMAEFSKLIGRFRMMAAAQQTKKVEYGRDEVVGVELSGDLSRMVPGELVNLAVPELEYDFLQRMTEGRLLSKQYRGTEKVGKGAIIAAIDCSGSMTQPGRDGVSGEAWAKALALALLDQASRSHRDFVAILFSSYSQQTVIQFPRGQSDFESVMTLAELFYNGGTNFQVPLELAMDKLEAEFNTDGKMKGDIVLVTDGICGVSPEWMMDYQRRKKALGFRTFGIQIGPTYGDTLEALSDNVRGMEDLTDPSEVSDIFRVVE